MIPYNPKQESELVKHIADSIEFDRMKLNRNVFGYFPSSEQKDLEIYMRGIIRRHLVSDRDVERAEDLLNSQYKDRLVQDVKSYLKNYNSLFYRSWG